MSGEVVLPGDDDYEAASAVNYSTGAPAVIVRAQSVRDVAQAVRYAASEGLVLSVRGGGHSGSGFGTNIDGLVIDLSALDSIEVLDGGLVRVDGGARWGAIAAALQPHNLALTSGDTTSVGVGGLTLGGGVGWMVRQYGLALDSLVAAEVVTASGDVVTASEHENSELFWALRGGGGNFGAVTSFTFQAHPLDGIVAGSIMLSADDLAPTLKAWRDAMRAAPEELNTTFLAMPAFGPEMPAATQILVVYAGSDESAASAAIEPLLRLPGVLSSEFAPKAYVDILEEAHPPEGVRIVDNNSFVADFSDEAIDKLTSVYAEIGGAVLMIRSLVGAFNRVPEDATAFGFRDSEVLLICAAFIPPDSPNEAVDRIRSLWKTLAPHTQGTYGNFASTVGDESTPHMYSQATLARLAQIKYTWDPGNLFSENHNILPVPAAE